MKTAVSMRSLLLPPHLVLLGLIACLLNWTAFAATTYTYTYNALSRLTQVDYGNGQVITYTLTVTNAGPGSANDVVVTDFLPAGLGNVVSDGALTTTHSLSIAALSFCGSYFFRVSSTDTDGNTTTADRGGAPFSFETGDVPGRFFFIWMGVVYTSKAPASQRRVVQ